jgi:hypothetical protein
MEIVKPKERALMAKSRDGLSVLYHRSMMVSQQVDSPWRTHATVQIEFRGEFGTQLYDLVRSAEQEVLASWANGSKMVITDKLYEAKVPVAATSTRSRSERYRS